MQSTYDYFVSLLINEINKQTMDRYQIERSTVNKNMTTLDALILHDGDAVAPTFYPGLYYPDYRNGKPISNIVQEMCSKLQDSQIDVADLVARLPLHDYDEMKRYLVIDLVSKENNHDFLQNAVHKENVFGAAIARVQVEISHDTTASIVVSKSMLDHWNISSSVLFQDALFNSMETNPLVIRSMNDVMKEILGIDSVEMDDDMMSILGDFPMYIVTNQRRNHGASVLLYSDTLESLSHIVADGGNMLVLPSSTHEVIVLDASYGNLKEASNMVRGINFSHVPIEEQLSNYAYLYNSTTKETSKILEDGSLEKFSNSRSRCTNSIDR